MTLPRAASALRGMARVASVIPVVIGVLVLVGWWADVEFLKRIVPGLVAMNPATAVAFICLGLSLALAVRDEGGSTTQRTLAIVAALIGLLKILAIVSPVDLEIDQLLFRDELDGSDRGLPNRMAPNTALNFVLLGIGLATIDRNVGKVWPAQFLTVVAAMSSLLALMGYAYGVKSFYGIGSYIPMALPTLQWE